MPLLFIHMVTTAGPLFFLPRETWSGFLVPTLEGQYIINNVMIIAVAIATAACVVKSIKSFCRLSDFVDEGHADRDFL